MTIFDHDGAMAAAKALVKSMRLKTSREIPAGKMLVTLAEAIAECDRRGVSLDCEFRLRDGRPAEFTVRETFSRRLIINRVFRADGTAIEPHTEPGT